ncbi:response regulator transcription factor [Agrococcus sp. 1P02AA]|uniref:response regulator n=1 Tax=Agrococcus sp. 1P02AA TaxID=3132259 RepID=UPI0039A5B840
MIRVLVADDQPLMQRALSIFIEGADDMEVVGLAADGSAAVTQSRALRPDVVLMDMQMPVMDGIEATRRVIEAHPSTKVIAVTTFSTEQYLLPALRAGASGFILKHVEPDELLEAVRAVHEGAGAISRQVTQNLIAAVRDAEAPARARALASGEELTGRELDVVRLLANGMSNAEIASALFVAEATVKSHLSRIMEKWQVRDRVQVLIRGAELGLVKVGV